METIDVAFEMPLDILDGINQGLLFRRGGVIVDGNSRVIMWLKQIPVEQIKKTSSILVQGTSIGTVSLATISFLYLQHNFIKINDKLDEINISLDAQNLSKLHSGFKLASEADLMTNKQHAKNQIIGARSLIEEGSNTFQHILNTLKPKTKNYTEKKLFLIECILQAEIGIIYTYIWDKEYILAKMRLLKLKEFVMKSIMKEIREEVNPKTNWTLTNILWVANPIAISYIGLYVAGIVGKDHYAMTKELKLLKEGNREIEFELESILVKVSDLNFKLSDSTHALINFNEILKGYIVEIDFYENEQIEYQEIKKLY